MNTDDMNTDKMNTDKMNTVHAAGNPLDATYEHIGPSLFIGAMKVERYERDIRIFEDTGIAYCAPIINEDPSKMLIIDGDPAPGLILNRELAIGSIIRDTTGLGTIVNMGRGSTVETYDGGGTTVLNNASNVSMSMHGNLCGGIMVNGCVGCRTQLFNDTAYNVMVNEADDCAMQSTGVGAVILAGGEYGTVCAFAENSLVFVTGYEKRVRVTGKGSVAVLLCGRNRNIVKAVAGTHILFVECEEGDEPNVIGHVRLAKVGQDGLSPDTWYTMKDGQVVSGVEKIEKGQPVTIEISSPA